MLELLKQRLENVWEVKGEKVSVWSKVSRDSVISWCWVYGSTAGPESRLEAALTT